MEIQYFVLACIWCVIGAAAAKPANLPRSDNPNALALFSRVFSLPNQSGNYLDVYNYIPSLFGSGIDNDIESVYQTGMWMYYDNNDYNTAAGRVYFVHGIELTVNFPYDYVDITSSVRYVGNSNIPNDDTWTLYEGEYFSGTEYYEVTDASGLDYMDLVGSSMVLTGVSPWTIYSGQGFTGDAVCVYPNTDHDVGPKGDVLDFGIYPDMHALGIPDNSIRSIRKGCWSKKVAPSVQMKYEGKAKNGAWGYADL